MTTLLTQAQIEDTMYYGGIKRTNERIAKAEAEGEASRNPYAATVFRDFVLPLAEVIDIEINKGGAGRRAAHAALLFSLDLEAVAVLTVRTVLSACLGEGRGTDVRRMGYLIGKVVHCELVLAQIAHLNPELYHTLARDFGRKHTTDVRHRMTVFKMQAAQHGIPVIEWPVGARDQVGLYLLDHLARLGMIEMDAPPMVGGKKSAGKRHDLNVRLSEEVMHTIDNIKGIVSLTSPIYGPCVEPPQDWTAHNIGGFHTEHMRRSRPYLIAAHGAARELIRGVQMPRVWNAVNALQKTAWAVNGRILDTVMEIAQHENVGEVVTLREVNKPTAPEFLAALDKSADMTPLQQTEFIQWKREMAEWYTARKLDGIKYGRFYSATRAATTFREYHALYFVHFADSRGRLYPLTYGISPQGSDLQKALLHFSKGKPLHTPEAVRWFLIHGANKFGFDKASLDDREVWHKDKHDMLMATASDPLNHQDWKQCDNPLQFLSWCFEYAEWCIDPQGFESHLAISMDGSCNGLQNFSAMLRDEVGGKATNLTNNAVMEDIYRKVADAALARMVAAEPDAEGLIAKWIATGISRSVVKRSVMTTPYGVTQRTAVNYVISDFLRKGAAPLFDKTEYFKAGNLLMSFVWPAIGDVVVKSREAMDWLKACARVISKSSGKAEGVISWVTPSGFVATQSYYAQVEHRINTKLHGTTKIKVVTEADDADGSRHASGLAPNFVHSMDASHLHLTTSAAALLGIDALAMIHDDYGTHAADAEAMYHLIRSEFVAMYTNNDPIQSFKDAYPECPVPPEKGTLDINEVLQSQYFFS